MIEFKCSKCSAAMSASAARIGQIEECPACGDRAAVPYPAARRRGARPPSPPSPPSPWGQGGGVETAVLLRRIFLAVGAVMMVIGAIVLIGAFPEYGSTSTVGAICGTMLLVGGVLMLPLAVIVGLLGKESDGE